MSPEFQLQLFFSRWVILLVLSVVLFEVMWASTLKSEVALTVVAWASKACKYYITPLAFISLTAFHVYQYTAHLSPFAAALGAGLISGAGTIVITYGYSKFRKKQVHAVHALLTILLFPVAVMILEPLIFKLAL